jgi:hypothetical protein
MPADPKRIQRKRTKGWRLPQGAIYVGRPTEWGNPFVVGTHGDAAECVRLYRLCILSEERPGDLTADQMKAANEAWPDAFHMPDRSTAKIFLGGHDLACWCQIVDKDGHPFPCHADVLLELANAG